MMRKYGKALNSIGLVRVRGQLLLPCLGYIVNSSSPVMLWFHLPERGPGKSVKITTRQGCRTSSRDAIIGLTEDAEAGAVSECVRAGLIFGFGTHRPIPVDIRGWSTTWKHVESQSIFQVPTVTRQIAIPLTEFFFFVLFLTRSFNLWYNRCYPRWNIELTRVDVGVFLHVGFLVKSFAAVLTWIRSRIRMDQKMSRQCRRPLERFTALPAFKNLFRAVKGSK